ncbi:MAG: hypothetical protein ABIQ35_02285 [Verrucomicrobiota bacterium]
MITPGTAELAVAVAKGLIKFGEHLDRLLAEKVAVQSPLALKLPAVNFSPGPAILKPRLRACLDQTSDAKPGPLGRQRRKALAELMAAASPDLAEMRRFYALAFPDEALNETNTIQPDANFLQFLRDAVPGLRETLPENAGSKDKAKVANYRAAVLSAAFYVDPGADARQLGYPVRVSLLVVDVLAELGAEHTQLFVKDEGIRVIATAVLERFAKPDLESFDDWSPVLRHTLSATLNGVLDARLAWQGKSPWFGAILQALADARESAGDIGDDYLLGLTEGKGYYLLLSNVLAKSADILDDQHAPLFQQIAADVLRGAAPLVASDPKGFGSFFNEHWADLLHAGLVSIDKHGPALLEGQSPLLREILLASIRSLSQTAGSELLSRETVFHLADAAIGAFASHPKLWATGNNQPWLDEFLQSVLHTVSNQGIAATFSKDGLETIVRQAAGRFAEHPEWLVKDPGMFQRVVGEILKRFSEVGALEAKTIAASAVDGALDAIAAHPEFIGTEFPRAIADFAGQLAAQVKGKTLTALQASDLIDAASQAALLHPELFASPKKRLAGVITDAVLAAGKNNSSPILSSATLVPIAQELFVVFAQRGFDAATDSAIGQLQDKLVPVLRAGIIRAESEMGRRLDVSALPGVLGGLVAAWLKGEAPALEPNDPAFQKFFAELAERALAAA